MVTYPSILAWEIPWTEGPGRIQFMDLQKVRHYLVIKQKILILLIDIMKIKTNSWANTSDNFHMHTHTQRHTHTPLSSLHQWDYILEKQLSPRSPEAAWELEVSSTAIYCCSPVKHFSWQYHRTSKWNKFTLWPWWIITRISLLHKHIQIWTKTLTFSKHKNGKHSLIMAIMKDYYLCKHIGFPLCLVCHHFT